MITNLGSSGSGKCVLIQSTRFEAGGSSAIFLKCSRFNHACHPHAACTYTWDAKLERLVVSTLREVAAGEELTISYMGKQVDRRLLQLNYGFQCDCPGCLEAKEAEAKVQKEAAACHRSGEISV